MLSKDEVIMMTYNTGGCNTPSPKEYLLDEDKEDSSGQEDGIGMPLEVCFRFYNFAINALIETSILEIEAREYTTWIQADCDFRFEWRRRTAPSQEKVEQAEPGTRKLRLIITISNCR